MVHAIACKCYYCTRSHKPTDVCPCFNCHTIRTFVAWETSFVARIGKINWRKLWAKLTRWR